MTICTYDYELLYGTGPDHATQEDQSRGIRLTETRKHNSYTPHQRTVPTQKLLLGICGRKRVGGVGVLVNTQLTVKIKSYVLLKSRMSLVRKSEKCVIP